MAEPSLLDTGFSYQNSRLPLVMNPRIGFRMFIGTCLGHNFSFWAKIQDIPQTHNDFSRPKWTPIQFLGKNSGISGRFSESNSPKKDLELFDVFVAARLVPGSQPRSLVGGGHRGEEGHITRDGPGDVPCSS